MIVAWNNMRMRVYSDQGYTKVLQTDMALDSVYEFLQFYDQMWYTSKTSR